MKLLHENKDLFQEVIKSVSQATGQSIRIVEKDYYVTMLLQHLSMQIPELVFKGGTSLSKCYKIIDRFSEDVDLSTDTSVSQKRREEIKKTLKDVVSTLGLKIVNIDETRSRMDYNKYIVEFDSIADEDFVESNVILEITYISTAIPAVKLPVGSIIGDYICDKENSILVEYELKPFKMKVQTLERTLVDKVFALCDYFMKNEYRRNSRHIYDVHQIIKKISLTDDLKLLVKQVRKERQKSRVAVSAQEGVNINSELQKIIDTQCFKNDFEIITSALVYGEVSYTEVITGLKKIIESKIFML